MNTQAEFDWKTAEGERALMEQWERNQAAGAHNWTDESMARNWAGFRDLDEWNALPSYERNQIIVSYQCEQEMLSFEIECAQPLYELIFPDGGSRIVMDCRRSIRPFYRVCPQVDKQWEDEHWRMARAMAEALSADWSANRPPSRFTYDQVLAGSVSMLLGRKIEAIEPREIE